MAELFKVNESLATMTPFLQKRTRTIYVDQQARCRKQYGIGLPYTLSQLREDVVLLNVNEPRCVYCDQYVVNEANFAIDHIVALERGGSWEISNLVLCCPACNAAKGMLSAEEFTALMTLIQVWDSRASVDLLRRLKIGGNPMAGRLLAGRK